MPDLLKPPYVGHEAATTWTTARIGNIGQKTWLYERRASRYLEDAGDQSKRDSVAETHAGDDVGPFTARFLGEAK